jgi:bis(5'-adenosyl)-triphosphatase
MEELYGDCPFCSDKINPSVFYEEGDYKAIYNIAPVLPGHSLIIPKKHITSLMDLSSEEMALFFDVARKTLRILMKAFSTDAFDWSIQEKPEAGQTIEHLHLHIVPRMKGDLKRPGDWYPLIADHDNFLIDSISRNRIHADAMKQITDELKTIAASLYL